MDSRNPFPMSTTPPIIAGNIANTQILKKNKFWNTAYQFVEVANLVFRLGLSLKFAQAAAALTVSLMAAMKTFFISLFPEASRFLSLSEKH